MEYLLGGTAIYLFFGLVIFFLGVGSIKDWNFIIGGETMKIKGTNASYRLLFWISFVWPYFLYLAKKDDWNIGI